MANLFWVGGSTAYDGVTNRLATTSGGAASVAVIAAGDTVTFDANSPAAAAVTTSAAISCTTLTLTTGFTGSLTMSNTLTVSGTVTLTNGTLNTNGQTCSIGVLDSSNSNTRSLTLGASAITITGINTAWTLGTVTGLTFNAGTSTITFTGANVTGQFGGQTYNNVVINSSTLFNLSGPSATFTNLTRTGGAVKTADLNIAASPTTITGTLTLAGNSATNRLLVRSNTLGTSRTLTAAVVVITNVDFRDINASGAAIPWTGTSLGDALGNSGITFDTPVTQTATGTASFTWSTHAWTTRVPLPQDNVVINNAFVAGRTITVDMPRIGADIDVSGATGGPNMNWTIPIESFGNVAMGSTVAPSGGTNTWTFSGRGAQAIYNNGVTWRDACRITVSAITGSYTLQDALIASPSGSPSLLSIATGTFNSNNFNITIGQLAASSGATLNLGTTTFTANSTAVGNILNINSGATLSAASSTIDIASATVARNFTGGGKTYGTLSYTVANSPGSLTIIGANTFTTLNIGPGRILTMTSSTVNTIASGGSFNVNGVNNGYLYLPGVTGNYASAPDSAALSVTGDIDIRVKVALDDWTPAAQSFFAGKGSGAIRSWDFGIGATGLLTLGISADGSTQARPSSTVATGLADGSTKWIRATWNDTTNIVKFYLSDDGAAWTQLGADVSLAAVGLFDSSGIQTIGIWGDGATGPIIGKLYRTQIRNNVLDNGTGIVFDADFTTKPFGVNSFTESSTNAATVTINGTLAQAGDGRVSLNSSTPGTAATLTKPSGTVSVDYLTVQDSTVTGGPAWFAGANSVSISNNTGWNFRASSPQGGNFFQVM